VTVRGHIKAGAIVLDEPTELPEGARVRCVVMVEPRDTPAPHENAASHAGLLKFAGVIKDSPPDAARNLDHYFYIRGRLSRCT